MSKTKKFGLIYQVETETTEDFLRLVFELQGNNGMEPEFITLPSGTKLPWNGYAAHQFVGEGRINEKEFIEISLAKQ